MTVSSVDLKLKQLGKSYFSESGHEIESAPPWCFLSVFTCAKCQDVSMMCQLYQAIFVHLEIKGLQLI